MTLNIIVRELTVHDIVTSPLHLAVNMVHTAETGAKTIITSSLRISVSKGA